MKMNVVIMGGGKIGTYLIKTMKSLNHEITIIEKNPEKCKLLADKFDILVIMGDGSEIEVLEDAYLSKASVFIAVTGRDEDNLIACELAKRRFNVPKIIARVNNPKNEMIFQKLGVITAAISGTTIISKIIEEEAVIGDFLHLFVFKEGKLEAIEVRIPEEAVVVSKKIKELRLPEGCIIAAIIRENEAVIPYGSSVILPGDTLIIFTSFDKEQILQKLLL